MLGQQADMVRNLLLHVFRFISGFEFRLTSSVQERAFYRAQGALVLDVIFDLPPLNPRHLAPIGTVNRIQSANVIVNTSHVIVRVSEATERTRDFL